MLSTIFLNKTQANKGIWSDSVVFQDQSSLRLDYGLDGYSFIINKYLSI